MILELRADQGQRVAHITFAAIITALMALGFATADLSAAASTWTCQANFFECVPRNATDAGLPAWWASRISFIAAYVAGCAWFKAALR